MTKVNAEDKQAALAEWRARHFEELDRNLSVLTSIRDNPKAKDKDKVDASKAINRMLDVVTPEKFEKVGIPKNTPAKRDLTQDERDAVRERLAS